jgi:hypothetical protein
MERSEIRERRCRCNADPGFHFVPSGLHSAYKSSRRTPRPACRLLRAFSTRCRKRGSFSRQYLRQYPNLDDRNRNIIENMIIVHPNDVLSVFQARALSRYQKGGLRRHLLQGQNDLRRIKSENFREREKFDNGDTPLPAFEVRNERLRLAQTSGKI